VTVRASPLSVIVAVIVATSACAKARAHTEPAIPVLTPPPPPPRVVEMYVDEPVPTIEPSPVDTALSTPPSRPPTRPTTTRPEPPRAEPARTEPERPVVAPPALTLKPAPGAETKTETSIRALMGQTQRDLQRVNYAALDADGRAQFDIAKRFMQQAEEALKGGNLPFAGKLADKAATMASVLVR
jgi:hypothetical protein